MTAEADKTAAYAEALERDRSLVGGRLEALVDELASHHAGMREAILYSLVAGGKRLRPILCLWSYDAIADGGRRDVALDVGCAVECVHTYSLIHDDLPCMDDDDLRRGRPSSHKRFGEATAVLCGDALLTLAFEVLATLEERHPGVDPRLVVDAVRLLSNRSGTAGLIAGQAMDMAAEWSEGGSVDPVIRIHEHKTARLISASMELGAVVADAPRSVRAAFERAGHEAGRAFQIADDLIDGDSSEETLGKTPGKDLKNRKLTYPSVAGADVSRREAADLAARAQRRVSEATGATALEWLLGRLVNRSR